MSLHPTAIIAEGAVVPESAHIGPYCIIGEKVVLGENVRLAAHVTIDGNTEIGAGAQIHAFASLGGPPQHLGYNGEDTKLIIGENAHIREQVTMNTGTVEGNGVTRIGDNGFFMTGAHVGHDCTVGDNVVFANNATLGGHVTIGNHVFLGGLCAIHQFCRVGDFAFIGGCAAVPTDVIPFGSAIGNHANLAGLNIIGMKRRGLKRPSIHQLRTAYKLLFEGAGEFMSRLDEVEEKYADNEDVMRIVSFIREDARRPIMQPGQ